RAAQGHAAGSPQPRLLCAVAGAARRVRGHPLGRGPGARGPGRTRRARRHPGAERARHRVRGPRAGAAQQQGRAHPGVPGKRDLRTRGERPRRPRQGGRVNLDHFGMDTITLAGSLEAKLRAARAEGFTQIMLNAGVLVGHADGEEAAVAAVRASGLRVTGFQVLRDFEGLSGHLHEYKVDIAKAMIRMCHALGSTVLLACSSTSAHAEGDPGLLAKDLRKLAMLAVPYGIRIAYEALSWGRFVNQFQRSWEIVQAADRANLGLCLDSFHILA